MSCTLSNYFAAKVGFSKDLTNIQAIVYQIQFSKTILLINKNIAWYQFERPWFVFWFKMILLQSNVKRTDQMKKHIINLSCLMLVASMTLLFSCTEEETEPEKSTNLKIIVTEENGTFVENAVVKIFTNENDWANNQNAAYP